MTQQPDSPAIAGDPRVADEALAAGGFRFVDVPTAQVDRWEAEAEPAMEAARRLARALIRTRADGEELGLVAKELDALAERLEADADPGPAGVRFNAEGRSWEWGNAAVGLRKDAEHGQRFETMKELLRNQRRFGPTASGA